MNRFNFFKYTGNMYKKSLEDYITKLKKIISQHLENNDLKKTKEIIGYIERLRKIQDQIDSIIQGYLEQFPEEKLLNKKLQNSVDDYIHYTTEILRIIKLAKQIKLYDLKSSIYNEIVGYISSKEISNNEKTPRLLNWEVSFFKSATLLLSKKFIEFDESNCLILTDIGEKYYYEDNEIDDYNSDTDENLDDLDLDEEIFNELIEKDKDMDLITSIRSYLLSNLIADGILLADEESNFYKVMFYVIKELKDIDGQIIESWDQIKENNYYIIDSFFRDNEKTGFVREKYDRYNIIECIDEDDARTFYAFI